MGQTQRKIIVGSIIVLMHVVVWYAFFELRRYLL
jgi:hypothetical protein